jgi:integrase
LIRQVLKHAAMNGQMTGLPLIPKPGKIDANPRPWLTRDEWTRVATLAVERVADAPNARTKRQREDLYDFMVFMIESSMRVNELRDLTVAQVQFVDAHGDHPEHLVIDVHGKRGHRIAVVGGAAVGIFQHRSKGRKRTDRLWAHGQRDAFRELLIAAKLRTDAFGNERNLRSLRATAISFKILAGAPAPNLLMIARNAGTSVTMIDQFYARRLSAAMGVSELATSTIV